MSLLGFVSGKEANMVSGMVVGHYVGIVFTKELFGQQNPCKESWKSKIGGKRRIL
jgi:hypothetical protein